MFSKLSPVSPFFAPPWYSRAAWMRPQYPWSCPSPWGWSRRCGAAPTGAPERNSIILISITYLINLNIVWFIKALSIYNFYLTLVSRDSRDPPHLEGVWRRGEQALVRGVECDAPAKKTDDKLYLVLPHWFNQGGGKWMKKCHKIEK